MKNITKCIEKLSDRVKAKVDEDAQITIQEISEAFDIDFIGECIKHFRRQSLCYS